jgi:hypothetical protein
MKLYEVPNETFIVVREDMKGPVGCEPIKAGTVLFFDHVDGLYSYCLDENKANVVHLMAGTEVDILKH